MFKHFADYAHSQGHKAPAFATAALRWANAFWWTLIAAGILWWLTNWKWAMILVVLACWSAFKNISATRIQQHLEKRVRVLLSIFLRLLNWQYSPVYLHQRNKFLDRRSGSTNSNHHRSYTR
jgi:hypothetical protein